MRAGASLEPPYGALLYAFTPWDIAYLVAVLAVALAAVGLLLGALVQQRPPFRRRPLALPSRSRSRSFRVWLARAGPAAAGERDISHVAFAISSLVTAWTLSRGRLFDLVPVAREAVFEHLTTPSW